MAQNRELTAQQRNILFAQSTRKNIQPLPSQRTNTGLTTLQFTLPKARYLSSIFLMVEAKIKIKHASQTTLTAPALTPYRVLNNVSVSLNNGFNPFTISGRDLALYNMVRPNPNVLVPTTNVKSLSYNSSPVASTTGATNTLRFMLECPLTTNKRDAVGMILLQNESTQVTLTIDIADPAAIYGRPAGYTFEYESVVISPTTETFTVPMHPDAHPDISVLKMVSARQETFSSNAQHVAKLTVGTTYRKMILYFEDTDGNPMAIDKITSNLELIFNTADIPVNVSPMMLRAMNISDLGFELPDGMYVFDFSSQGITNYGGSRDMINTRELTEFWLRFTASDNGKVIVISENIADLARA